MARNLERAISRLEKAGGEVSEASALLSELGPRTIPVNGVIRLINIALGDARRALVMLENGDSGMLVGNKLEQQMEDLFGITDDVGRNRSCS